ncbi:MAG: exodeoxyribonuclease V subunit gamma, partial [Desulfobacteraceae bacterium]
MPIELFFSNQVERLAEKLSDHLSYELVNRKNKLEPMAVIVPNQNMVKWLQLTLSKLQAVLLNIHFDFLENGLWYLLADLDHHRLAVRLMDHKVRTLKLIQVLKKLDLNDPILAPIATYLLDTKGNKRIDLAPRLWQLAERLSRLFQEYEYHRVDMIDAWQKNKDVKSKMERCQQYLYCTVYRQTANTKTSSGFFFTSLLEYANRILNNNIVFDKITSRTIHIFGMSQISSFHYELFGRLAAYHTINFYTLNPSKEFWEDIQTPRERRWFQKKQNIEKIQWTEMEDEYADSPSQDHPLSALWGKMGRENVRQLCSLTDYTFNTFYSQFERQDVVLHRLQNDLLTLTGGRSSPSLAQDTSLQMFACPSKFREVETVYHTICYNLRQDNTLKLTDMAILVPDMNLYKPIFDAVFNRRPDILSYNIVDSNAQAESLYGQAIVQILDLAQGRFSRKAVFELLLNPCLMQRWGISVEEIRDWVSWADELNIFHTYSRKNYKDKVNLLKAEHFSWKQALRR